MEALGKDNMLKKENIIIVLVILFIIIALIIVYSKKIVSSDYDFKIYFFNAGKADAILLSKNDKYILIDKEETEKRTHGRGDRENKGNR